ncbi:hypothetical protein MHYP_G00221680 [Metynnis hypsauchen]
MALKSLARRTQEWHRRATEPHGCQQRWGNPKLSREATFHPASIISSLFPPAAPQLPWCSYRRSTMRKKAETGSCVMTESTEGSELPWSMTSPPLPRALLALDGVIEFVAEAMLVLRWAALPADGWALRVSHSAGGEALSGQKPDPLLTAQETLMPFGLSG